MKIYDIFTNFQVSKMYRIQSEEELTQEQIEEMVIHEDDELKLIDENFEVVDISYEVSK